MSNLVLGQPVEVNQIWASRGGLHTPIKSWFSDYVLHAIINNVAVVKQVKPGLFEGCLIN